MCYLPWLSWWWLGCSAIVYIRQPATFPAQPTNEHVIDPFTRVKKLTQVPVLHYYIAELGFESLKKNKYLIASLL